MNMNELMDRLNDFLSERRGLLPLVGIGLIILNFILQFLPLQEAKVISSHFFLHLGLIIAIIGFLLIKPLQ